jgi:alkylation response protein AidB-like acyl-CoA dehydrogenase
MQLQWNDEQLRIRAHFQAFGAQEIASRAESCYAQGKLDHVGWQQLADEGFWRLPVACELGGHGQSWWEFVAALEGLATSTRDLGFLLSIVAHSGTIRGLVEYGTEGQRERWLERLLSGAIGATAMTETSGGSDVARIMTSAEPLGDGFVLTGAKRHITNAPVADIALVLARMPTLGARDITVFIVEPGSEGVVAGDPEDMFGNRTSPTGPLDFEVAALDAEQILGEPGNGLQTIYNVIAMDRMLYGVIAAGYIEPILQETFAFAQQREAFKAPIADHQYIQGRLIELRVTIDTVRAASYTALSQLLAGDSAASMSCSVAKLIGCEGLCQATQHAMAILGHRGYMTGPATRAAADTLGTRIAGGTAEMQRKNIFNQMAKQYATNQQREPTCLTSISA